MWDWEDEGAGALQEPPAPRPSPSLPGGRAALPVCPELILEWETPLISTLLLLLS